MPRVRARCLGILVAELVRVYIYARTAPLIQSFYMCGSYIKLYSQL